MSSECKHGEQCATRSNISMNGVQCKEHGMCIVRGMRRAAMRVIRDAWALVDGVVWLMG